MAPVFQGVDDGVLQLVLGAAGGSDGASIRHRNVSLAVDRLTGKRYEIAGPNASFGGNEQVARASFEDGDADGVADAEAEIGRAPLVAKFANQSRSRLRKHFRHSRCQPNQDIRLTFGRRDRTLDVPALRPHAGTGSKRQDKSQGRRAFHKYPHHCFPIPQRVYVT